jgi:8-amino-7-oxononanoate synthase
MGTNGAGMVCSMGVEQDLLARVYTFGKGMGVHGACIAGSSALIEYLINFGRAFIYTTALPIHSVFSIDAAFDYIRENHQLQNALQDNIEYFNRQYDLHLDKHKEIHKPFSDTAIQPLIVPGNDRIKIIAQKLQQEGLDVRPILSPTVKAGSERLRISLHAHNTKEEIDQLIQSLTQLI